LLFFFSWLSTVCTMPPVLFALVILELES
jgi:hypothetical protein